MVPRPPSRLPLPSPAAAFRRAKPSRRARLRRARSINASTSDPRAPSPSGDRAVRQSLRRERGRVVQSNRQRFRLQPCAVPYHPAITVCPCRRHGLDPVVVVAAARPPAATIPSATHRSTAARSVLFDLANAFTAAAFDSELNASFTETVRTTPGGGRTVHGDRMDPGDEREGFGEAG